MKILKKILLTAILLFILSAIPTSCTNAGDIEIHLRGTSDYPFASSAPDSFMLPLNQMWHRFGAVNDGDNAVQKFGNEPTYFDWVATKIMWSNETEYKNELKAKIRDFAISADGYLWSWTDNPRWPSGNSLHFGNNINYINAVYKIICWENSTDFLNWTDATTSAPGDVSNGLTVAQKIDMATGYIINDLSGSTGTLVINNGENTGLGTGNASNYWDNLPLGHKDAYTSIYFCKALESIAGIKRMQGNDSSADYYENLAATAKANYNSNYWNSSSQRYSGCVDITGKMHDYGFTFINIEALANGIGDAAKASSIYSWLDGKRIIESDTSTGSDIYDAFIYAPRSNTKAIETILPAWWNTCSGQIIAGANASWGEHLENGGAIFYVSFYDILARAAYLGADNAFSRFSAITGEFRKDALMRDRLSSYSCTWVEGVIGEFPESGLVPTAYLYAFIGAEASHDGLHIRKNIPSNMSYAQVKDLCYSGSLFNITVKENSESIYTKSGSGNISIIFENLPHGENYEVSNRDITNNNTNISTINSGTVGKIEVSENIDGEREISIKRIMQ